MESVSKWILAVLVACSACRADTGEALFLAHCAPCHGPKGDGGKGANLAVPRLSRASDDSDLAKIIVLGIPGTGMPSTRMTDAEAQRLVSYVRSLGRTAPAQPPGNPKKGKEIFWNKGNCGECHTAGPRGGRLGPDLSEIGVRRNPAFLRSKILDPESSIPDNLAVYRRYVTSAENFLQVRVVTTTDKSITGVRLNEDTFSIQIRDFSGRIHSFLKEELKELHKDLGKTPMPSSRGVLSDQEIQDLVAFLASLKGQ